MKKSAEKFIQVPAFEVAARLMAQDEFVRTAADPVVVGKTISHFRVLEKLGQGGMGVVYRAEDIHLGCQVALKFLPEDSRDPQSIERFKREARAASSLNHPNICHINEIDERGYFFSMELLEGQTLQSQIRGKPVPTILCSNLLCRSLTRWMRLTQKASLIATSSRETSLSPAVAWPRFWISVWPRKHPGR